MPFDDDVREPEDGEPIPDHPLPLPSPFAWLPARFLDCMRCGAVTLTREARCARCGWREGT